MNYEKLHQMYLDYLEAEEIVMGYGPPADKRIYQDLSEHPIFDDVKIIGFKEENPDNIVEVML